MSGIKWNKIFFIHFDRYWSVEIFNLWFLLGLFVWQWNILVFIHWLLYTIIKIVRFPIFPFSRALEAIAIERNLLKKYTNSGKDENPITVYKLSEKIPVFITFCTFFFFWLKVSIEKHTIRILYFSNNFVFN